MAARKNTKFTIGETELKALVRFEDGVFIPTGAYENIEVLISGPIEIRFEDLKIAVERIAESNFSSGDLWKTWLGWLDDELCLWDESLFHINESADIDIPGISSDLDQFANIWTSIEDKILDDCDSYTWNDILKDINKAIRNRGKSALDREYDSNEEAIYIENLNTEKALEQATEEQLFLFKVFVEKGAKAKRKQALYAVAYGCYGGNRAFECDWKRSEEALLTLMEIGDNNPFLANTLGYIYYYGRTNNGEPLYDKAFKYFSIGAAGGVYESRYKLADMFKHGYSIPKNTRIENQIIEELYRETVKCIAEGIFDSKFADVALRKGCNLLDGDMDSFVSNKILLAYHHLLQADFAIKRRQECCDYYGDAKVFNSIQEAIQRCRAEGSKQFKDFGKHRYSLANTICDNLYYGRRLELKATPLANGSYSLSIRALKRADEDHDPKLFVTILEHDFCGMLPKLKATIMPDEDFSLSTENEPIIFDEIDGCSLISYGKEVACLSGKIRVANPSSSKEKTYRVACVCFNGSEFFYDYFCDDLSIKAGDDVLVGNPADPTKVRVVKITEKKEYELALPLRRYKKVLGKAE